MRRNAGSFSVGAAGGPLWGGFTDIFVFLRFICKIQWFERSWTFYVKGGESVFSALMDSSEGFGPANVENFTDIL